MLNIPTNSMKLVIEINDKIVDTEYCLYMANGIRKLRERHGKEGDIYLLLKSKIDETPDLEDFKVDIEKPSLIDPVKKKGRQKVHVLEKVKHDTVVLKPFERMKSDITNFPFALLYENDDVYKSYMK